jgi:hypothetical protein
MPAAAKEEMLASPSTEEIFSLAAGVVAALVTRDGENAARGKKTHQEIFSKNEDLASAQHGLSGQERIRIEASRGRKPCWGQLSTSMTVSTT